MRQVGCSAETIVHLEQERRAPRVIITEAVMAAHVIVCPSKMRSGAVKASTFRFSAPDIRCALGYRVTRGDLNLGLRGR